MSEASQDPVSKRVHKWLGGLPVAWKGARLFEVADAWTSNVDKHTTEGQPSVRLCNYVDVYKNDVIVSSLDFMTASATRQQISKFRIRVGDTLITKDSETADDIGVPAFVEYEADDLICGYHLAIVRPDQRKVAPKFLKWVLDSEPIARQWSVTAAGVTRVGIRSTDLNKVTIPLPPIDEQRIIADYLDHETAQIDALVAKQGEFIGLLRERRDSVVSKVVARGVDRATDLQDTGLVGAELVPSHWRLVPFRYAVEFQEGPGIMASDFRDSGVPLLRVSSVRGAFATLEGCNYLDPDKVSERWSHFRLSLGDLLISASASMGTVSEVTKETVGAVPYTGIIRLRPVQVLKEFVKWLVVSKDFLEQVDSLKTGATIQHFGPSHLSQMKVALPPLCEQKVIADHLNDQTSRIDALIAKAEEHILLAKERRASLITAAVTGQIDARAARKAG